MPADGFQPDPVVVVGAGPTGMAVATLLALRGVPSLVLDRHSGPYPGPRAVHLDDGAVRILQQLGVHQQFAGISRPMAGLRLLDARGRPFAEFRRDRAPGRNGHPEANLFDQPDLDALLRANLARHPAVALRGGVEVTAVDQHGPQPVRVTLRDTITGAEQQLPAAAVLGCDGAASTVRATIGARLRDLRFTERWLVVDLVCRRPLDRWGGVDQICDPARAATFMRLTGDRYRCEFRMDTGETAADLGRPERLATLTERWLRGVPAGEWEVIRIEEYTFRARVADRWRRGRVLLLGDAAHLTPPFIGQGLGAGLRDAHNLAWKLALVLQGRAGEDLLDTYQSERAPHAESMIRTAVLVGRAMTGGQGTAAILRRPVVTALLRLPGAEARALAGTATRYPPSPFADRRNRRRDLPGTLCPQPWVRLGGVERRLDDVLGEDFALLCTGPVDPALAARARGLDARTVRMGTTDPGPTAEDEIVIEDNSTLRRWLLRGRSTAVLLRPDRIVLATDAAGAGRRSRAAATHLVADQGHDVVS